MDSLEKLSETLLQSIGSFINKLNLEKISKPDNNYAKKSLE